MRVRTVNARTVGDAAILKRGAARVTSRIEDGLLLLPTDGGNLVGLAVAVRVACDGQVPGARLLIVTPEIRSPLVTPHLREGDLDEDVEERNDDVPSWSRDINLYIFGYYHLVGYDNLVIITSC